MLPTTEILALVNAPDDAAYALELSQTLTPAFLARLRLRPLLAGERLADAHVLLVLESPGLTPALHDLLDHARGQGRLLIPIPLRACLAPPSALRGLKQALDEVILRDDTAALPRAARDAAWNQVALSLDLAVTRHRERRGPHPRATRRRHLVPDPRRALYLEVLRERESFVVRHLMPSPRGLELLGERRSSARDPADGQALFHLLFPEESWRPTLHRVLRLAHPSAVVPTNGQVALRVLCQDGALPPGLLHDLRWEGYPLRDASWTCEWAARTPQSGTPEDIRALGLPARTMILGATSHDDAAPVLEALSRVAPVRDGRAELVGLHLAGQPASSALPDTATTCEILLILGRAPGLPVLLRGLRSPPLLAYVDHPLPPGDLAMLRSQVPVVIVGHGARPLLLRFLRTLPLSPDPVDALYRAARQAARPAVGPPEDLWPNFPTVYSRGLLQVKAEDRPPLEGSSWLKLDRSAQRGQAKHVITEGLLRSRLVEAMVVFGARGNHVGDFLQQMKDELIGQVELLDPVRMEGLNPAQGDDGDLLPSRLRRSAAVDLCGSDEPTLGEALATHGDGPEVQLLILSYGVHDYGGGPGQVTPQALQDWLSFCAALTKEARLPPKLRVLCYLALELDEDEHEAMLEILDQQARLISRRFSFCSLPPLRGIVSMDLKNFLSDQVHCNCPEYLVDDVMELIMKKHRGNYEATLRCLRRAMDEVGWEQLVKELRDGGAQP